MINKIDLRAFIQKVYVAYLDIRRKPINENMNEQIGWYKLAQSVTPHGVNRFISKLNINYKHDYGTICHAIAASAIAGASAMMKTDQGGISGNQANAVTWEFIRQWVDGGQFQPRQLMAFSDLLWPQNASKFQIPDQLWKWLQDQAKQLLDKNLKDIGANLPGMDKAITDHLQSIVDGYPPFGLSVAKE